MWESQDPGPLLQLPFKMISPSETSQQERLREPQIRVSTGQWLGHSLEKRYAPIQVPPPPPEEGGLELGTPHIPNECPNIELDVMREGLLPHQLLVCRADLVGGL